MTKLYQALARKLAAMANCAKNPDTTPLAEEWYGRHKDRAEKLVKENMPSGSGFDNGTTLDFDKSTPQKLIFNTAFHHMNDAGMYDGWTKHTVMVRPSLTFDIDITISGRDRNQIKDYMYDTFQGALESYILE